MYAFAFVHGEANFAADGERLEVTLGQGVGMEVDFESVRRLDEAMVITDLAHDATVKRNFM
jgi:hypothetical protein